MEKNKEMTNSKPIYENWLELDLDLSRNSNPRTILGFFQIEGLIGWKTMWGRELWDLFANLSSGREEIGIFRKP